MSYVGIVKVKKLYEDAKIPTKGSEYAAGFDLYLHLTDEDTPYKDNEGRRYIDYRGEVFVALHKDETGAVAADIARLYEGDRIAQLLIKEVPPFIMEEVEELDTTERGIGGFGSTGLN